MAERSDEIKRAEEMKRRHYRATDVRSADMPTSSTEEIERGGQAFPGPEGDRDMENIEAGIRRTQAEMGETIQEIEERLSPERFKKQARGQAEEAKEATMEMAKYVATSTGRTIERMRGRITDMVKENPMPLALVGLGLAWFIKGSSKTARKGYGEEVVYPGERPYGLYKEAQWPETEYYYGEEPEYDYPHAREMGYEPWAGGEVSGQAQGMMGKAKEAVRGAQEKVQEYAGQARERMSHLGETAQEYAGQARERMSHLGETAEEYTGPARERMSHMGETARYRAQRTGSSLSRMLNERPWTIGMAALAIGTIVGLSIPETRWEEETMGGMRDDLAQRAKEAGYEAKERVKRVAEEAGRAAKEEATRTVEETGRTAKEGAERTVEQTERAARKEAQKQDLPV